MRRSDGPILDSAIAKLKGASDFEIEVTLTAQEADTLLRWVLSEKYRR